MHGISLQNKLVFMHTCLSSTGGNYVFGTDAYDLFYITEETGCKYLFEMMNY